MELVLQRTDGTLVTRYLREGEKECTETRVRVPEGIRNWPRMDEPESRRERRGQQHAGTVKPHQVRRGSKQVMRQPGMRTGLRRS